MYDVPFSIICTSPGTRELRITQLHASVEGVGGRYRQTVQEVRMCTCNIATM